MADTIWSAFTALNMAEWEKYLDFRKRQGFNALQINILPQCNSTGRRDELEPFAAGPEGHYVLSMPNPQYFDRACQMLRMSQERGFTPALRYDCVPDRGEPYRGGGNLSSIEEPSRYLSYVVDRFSQFDPIFIIGSDKDYQTQKSWAYDMTALKLLKEQCPDALTAMHIGGEQYDLPEELLDAPELDFFTYQSGHGLEGQNYVNHLAEVYMGWKPKRPIVSAEPCCEGHAYGNKAGRFTRFDVRMAVWQSLLSGSKAGVVYGAHGIRDLHGEFAGGGDESFSGALFGFHDALRLEGAWDMGFAKWVFETFELNDIEPVRMVLNDISEIRSAVSEDKSRFMIYAPYAAPLRLAMDVSDYSVMVIELEERHFLSPVIQTLDGNSFISMQPFNSDVIIIGSK